ncbi:hypothetical protein EV424DRAFT_268506 [Suillus variegatus]|nr:hypothetical protein EV424DRAFT_268506 [Suillus variegatus]
MDSSVLGIIQHWQIVIAIYFYSPHFLIYALLEKHHQLKPVIHWMHLSISSSISIFWLFLLSRSSLFSCLPWKFINTAKPLVCFTMFLYRHVLILSASQIHNVS